MKLVCRRCSILIISFVLGTLTLCYADETNFNVCEQVREEHLAAIYGNKLFPNEQEHGCQWSDEPGGRVYFQIGVIESQKHLRDYFQKEMPPNFELKKINNLGDRCLITVSEENLAVIVIREGDWILVSTVNFLNIKHGSEKQEYLWDIYRGILRKLP